jgi:hypothetical protein
VAEVGPRATITCNYDRIKRNHSLILAISTAYYRARHPVPSRVGAHYRFPHSSALRQKTSTWPPAKFSHGSNSHSLGWRALIWFILILFTNGRNLYRRTAIPPATREWSTTRLFVWNQTQSPLADVAASSYCRVWGRIVRFVEIMV